MFTALSPTRVSGSVPEPAAASAVDMGASPDIDPARADLIATQARDLPVVVLDLRRAAQQYRALAAAFPAVKVHYDVSALAHPALVRAISEAGGHFLVSHERALPALAAGAVDLSDVLHATPVAHAHELVAAYDAGVRRFVVEGRWGLEVFAGAPRDVCVIVRLASGVSRSAHLHAAGIPAKDAVRALGDAATLGVPVAGLSIGLPQCAGPADYVTAIAQAAGIMADSYAATGRRLSMLDLGDAFPGTASHPGERAELARAIRALVSPQTSGVVVTASASHSVTAGCVTVVARSGSRDVDPLVASECIDSGADVLVLHGDDRVPSAHIPFFRAVLQSRHRVLRPRTSADATWSPAD